MTRVQGIGTQMERTIRGETFEHLLDITRDLLALTGTLKSMQILEAVACYNHSLDQCLQMTMVLCLG